ncbi:glycoside hydrolase family 88 protein [Butyrivibrio sp. DSM 10294]|uniref:glycoside hydrolase family 88 protein n=1 Tax=Butyrivibrio sp. DSM 10294 TaxID=2972457 RepID=UPI00234EECE8|nr:glycoside hydrolase family 88 protein [Butyrivibrio sp. DSM 10294]MDC7294374.1 glycoside hydrolase family 88 protein [Butyrivibrio sp. DSM 10294]
MSTDWSRIADKIIRKEKKVAARSRGKIPYTAAGHVFDDKSDKKDICWWTNGFYGGMMWQLYHATGNELFRECAEKLEVKMDAAFMDYNGMDHDAGFRWLPTAVANYRLSGSKESKNRGLLAAASLAGRFNLKGNFIRAWNDWGDDRDTTGWAIIDCMMNLPLLYWASDVLKDPRFKDIAVAHADTAMEWFIREDGSVRHIVGFDPVTGEFDREYGGQGYGEGSSWTRGQTWALYGFTLSFIHTGDEHYLETAMQVADRFCSRIPEDGLIPVDFDQPAEPHYIDSTAAAIASCGLLTLEKELKEKDLSKAAAYRAAAEKMLSVLDEKDCDYDPEHDELLTRCSASYHDKDHEFPIIYGDYYYIEAIWKLTDKELFIW